MNREGGKGAKIKEERRKKKEKMDADKRRFTLIKPKKICVYPRPILLRLKMAYYCQSGSID
jgi:hypothetical protein